MTISEKEIEIYRQRYETFRHLDRLRGLGRRLIFFEAPEALNPERRRNLETWLHNRRHGREGLEAGRTIGEALAELEGDSEDVAAIRRWLKEMAAG